MTRHTVNSCQFGKLMIIRKSMSDLSKLQFFARFLFARFTFAHLTIPSLLFLSLIFLTLEWSTTFIFTFVLFPIFFSLTFNRAFGWICLFFLKWCFSYELLFFWNYLAPKHFLIDLFLKWVTFIVIFHYHSSTVNFCLELFLIFVKVT